MTGRDCERFEPHLSALLDGELTAPAAAPVEAHVRSCPACAALARDLARVSRTLRTWDAGEPPVAVSAGFRSRVLDGVGGIRRRRGAPVPELPASPLLRWTPALAAAATVAILVGASRLLQDPAGGAAPGAPPPVTAYAPDAAPSGAADLLASADAHRAAGRTDRERSAVLAAWGLAPEDPAVRAAFARTFAFDAPRIDRAPGGAGSGAAARPFVPPGAAGSLAGGGSVTGTGTGDGPAAGSEEEFRDYWAGPYRFTQAPAYDGFLDYRDLSRELEVAAAAREVVEPRDTVTVAAARPSPPARHPFSRLLSSLDVEAPVGGNGSVTWQGIVLYPLRLSPLAAGLPVPPGDPVSLEEAMASRRAELRDSPGRSTGTVLVTNLDPERPILVMAGEILEGGRADRMVSRDVLVPAGGRHCPVPVYDVEVGRGSPHPFGTRFRATSGVAGARLRGLAIAGATGEEVASFVRARLDLLDVTSSKRSLADAYSDRGPAAPVLRGVVQPQVAALLKGIQDEDIVGFALAQGTELLSVEVFGSHRLMLRHARRVLEGAAVESSTYAGGGRSPQPGEVASMLAAAERGVSFGIPPGATEAGSSRETRPGEFGVLALEGGLLGSGIERDGYVLHATVLRGAGAGALAGRTARSGDLPGGGSPVPGGSGPGGGGGRSSEGGGSEDPSTAGSDEPARPADSSPTTDRPR